MADSPKTDDRYDVSPTVEDCRERTVPGRTPELRLTIVEYEKRPTKGTIFPPGLTGIERMETWLSADFAAFVDLEAWR